MDGKATENSFKCLVDEDDAGARLDIFLSEQYDGLSRSQLKKLIERGSVLVNGESSKASYTLKTSDTVTVSIPDKPALAATPQRLALDIVFEDSHLIVVDKAAGMVVHPAAGNPDGTLVNALLGHCDRLANIGAPLRPGIVHRLDKDTSGLIVTAKDDASYYSLSKQFQDRTVDRNYSALAFGVPKERSGVIKSTIGRHLSDRKRFSSITTEGKEAITEWEVERKFKNFALFKLKLRTGRTHQIRVHMKEMGFPLVGDPVYGSRRKLNNLKDKALKENLEPFKRQALHAFTLGFVHPVTKEKLFFESKLPEDLENIISAIEKFDKN